MRNAVLWAIAFLVLAVLNGLIISKELILRHGQVMLLSLEPRDPRSLMQGDYMALRYRLATAAATLLSDTPSQSGAIVVTLNEQGIASLLRVHETGAALAQGEQLLEFRKRGQRVVIGSPSFFFQEGRGNDYAGAAYGEFRVSKTGRAVLVALRGKNFERLGGGPISR